MNRRGFLKSLFGVALVPLVPKFLKAQPRAAVPLDWSDNKIGRKAGHLSTSTLRKVEEQLTANAMPFKGRHYDLLIIDDLVENKFYKVDYNAIRYAWQRERFDLEKDLA